MSGTNNGMGAPMLLSDEFLSRFPSDALSGVVEAHEMLLEEMSNTPGWTDNEIEHLNELLALLHEAADAKLLPFTMQLVFPTCNAENAGDANKQIGEVVERCKAYIAGRQSKQTRARIRAHLGIAFAYELTDGDVSRVQTLINELREMIGASDKFETEHQQRLLRRLEQLQSEIHKRVSDLDRAWGVLHDGGVLLRKLGEDAKPMVDRFRELAGIFWQVQSRAEQLPSGTDMPVLTGPTTPRLPNDSTK